jgi:hypothetical protein
MQKLLSHSNKIFLLSLLSLALSSCATYQDGYSGYSSSFRSNYASRIPDHMNTGGQKLILIDPVVHVWGAYNAEGNLVHAGLATAGGNWCPDIGRPCRTDVGTFRINSLGDGECISRIYPRPNGGGLMPYCMFFSGGQALHGSPDETVIEDNVSHGCVRMRIPDAEWLRYNFATAGTKVIIRPY